MEPQVIIALAPDFISGLAELPPASHIWLVRAPESERLAESLRARRSCDDNGKQGSVTLFNSSGDREADLVWLLDEVELHHGLASNKESPVTVIKLLGIDPTPAVLSELASHNFADITDDPDGITARWVAPS
jgi:hypothetical protein